MRARVGCSIKLDEIMLDDKCKIMLSENKQIMIMDFGKRDSFKIAFDKYSFTFT